MKNARFLPLAGLILLLVSFMLPRTHKAGLASSDLRDAPGSTDALNSLRGYDSALPVPQPARPDLAALLAQSIVGILKNPSQYPAANERRVLVYFGKAYEAGILDQTIMAVLNAPELQSSLPPSLTADKAGAAKQLSCYIGAELATAGLLPGVSGAESWAEMAQRHLKMVKASAYEPRGPGQPPLFSEAGFVKEFAALTGAPFVPGNKVTFLVDGPASFAERARLIKGARKSVHILTWAVYDDETGRWALELLKAKRLEGVEVKVMVDGKVSEQHGKDILPLFSQAGIEVLRFQDASRKYDGMHCKVMIVDGKYTIAGGMNFGNEYSHMGNGAKWRDTDVLITGPAVARFSAIFDGFWNGRAGSTSAGNAAAGAAGGARVSVVTQAPGQESSIMLGILKAIYGAGTRINIENAYVVMMPSLRTALLDALARGVRVNILTNSKESIDEPLVSVPILKSLPEMLQAGAHVYLKRGDTLHSKFLTVDGVFCNIGSFNLHPRSIRYENEIIANILDRNKTAELDAIFENDISRAQRITGPQQLDIPASIQTDLIQKYFFNQL